MISYHARACALAGIAPRIDASLLDLLRRREAELAVRIPVSVAEWYALPGAVEHVAGRTPDVIPGLDRLGLPYMDCDFAEEGGLLMVAGDSQDCFQLAVPLDGPPDDPPVYLVDFQDLSYEPSVLAPSFSDYVYTLVWDLAAFHTAHRAEASDLSLADEHLTALGERFTVEPASGLADPGLQTVHRFGRPGQWVTVTVWRDRARLDAYAQSADELAGLTRTLADLDIADQWNVHNGAVHGT